MHPPFFDLGRRKIPQKLLPACLSFRSFSIQLLLSSVLLGLMAEITDSGEAWRNPVSLGSDMRSIVNLKKILVSGFEAVDPGKKMTRKVSQATVFSEADPSPLTSKADNAATGTPATGNPSTGTPATGNPTTGTPATGNPSTGTPATGNPTTGTPATGNPATGTPAKGNPSTGTPATGNPALP